MQSSRIFRYCSSSMINFPCLLIEQVICHIHANMGKVLQNMFRMILCCSKKKTYCTFMEASSQSRIVTANQKTVPLDCLRLYDWVSRKVWLCTEIVVEFLRPKKPVLDSDKKVQVSLDLLLCSWAAPVQPTSACVEVLVFCISMAVRRAPCALVSQTGVIQSPRIQSTFVCESIPSHKI